jgi:MFS family permease
MGLCVIGDSMLYTALPACFMDIGLDAQTTGAILSVNRFARLLFNPAAAVVLLRLGQKRTAVVAACLAVFTTMGYSFVTTPAAWLTLRVLWGLSWSLIRLTAFVVTLSEVRETRRGEALGGMQRLVRLGSLAGAFGGGFLLDLVGFRSTARILGTLTCVAVLLSLVLRVPKPQEEQISGSRPALSLRQVPPLLKQGWPVYSSALLSAVAIGGVFISTAGVLLRSRVVSHGLVFAGVGLGTLTGFVQASRWASDILLAPLVGRLSDRLGRALPLALIYSLQLFAACAILFSQGVLAAVAAGVLMFSAQAVALVVLSSAAADVGAGEKSALSMTMYSTCLDLGEATGPILAYSLLDFGLARTYSLGTIGIGALALFWGFGLYTRLLKKADAQDPAEDKN